MIFNKLLRDKPEPASQDRAYVQGRVSADLDAWERSVPIGPHLLIDCGEREDPCPYRFRDEAARAQRVAWLTGYYDEIVDQTELRVRRKMGLPEINWDPPPVKKKVSPNK